MYDDIGKKIKILSKVLGILSAIGAIPLLRLNRSGAHSLELRWPRRSF